MNQAQETKNQNKKDGIIDCSPKVINDATSKPHKSGNQQRNLELLNSQRVAGSITASAKEKD